MINKLKSLYFRALFKEGKEYWIDKNKVIIQESFANSVVGEAKMKHKLKYWYKQKAKGQPKCNCPIVLNRNFVLIDGYTSYLIWTTRSDNQKIPVTFKDTYELR